DEVHRAKDADVAYLHNTFPLLDIGWTRRDCRAYLAAHGLGDTPRSACIGCPYRSNASWRELKAADPAGFADAVAFDAAIRHGHPAAATPGMPPRRTYYLHRDRIPLAEVDLGTDAGPEPPGCSPWACRGDAETGGRQCGRATARATAYRPRRLFLLGRRPRSCCWCRWVLPRRGCSSRCGTATSGRPGGTSSAWGSAMPVGCWWRWRSWAARSRALWTTGGARR